MTNYESGVKSSELFSWLGRVVVPKIVENLGKDDSDFRFDIKPFGCFVIGSCISSIELTFFSSDKKPDKILRFVVKIPSENEFTREVFRTEFLFGNEIIFYEKLSEKWGACPKCVLTVPEPVERAVIVLGDVTQLGYRALPSGLGLGMDRILASVREIGKFHGRGYVLKEKNPEEFFELTGKLRDANCAATAHRVMIGFINGVALRPVNYLRSLANHDAEFCEKISVPFSSMHETVFQDCVKPRNELAVICHGDFTAANVLYREEASGGVGTILIDFAQIRFASPGTDLSIFLYISCNAEERKNFPAIFKAYHDTVVELLEAEGIADPEKYSFTNFLADYKRHAIFGWAGAVFFKSVLKLEVELDFENIIENAPIYIEALNTGGGDELSKEFADMLLELKDHGCLDHLL